MNGLNEIRNINYQRVQDEANALAIKADLAAKQNHPQAEVLKAQAEALTKSLLN